MDSLDSISSCGGISFASSSCSGSGAHSRQVSADSTSSPTNFSSPSSAAYIGSRVVQGSGPKSSHNPHRFIQAGPSSLFKTVSSLLSVSSNTLTFYWPKNKNIKKTAPMLAQYQIELKK